MALPTALNNLLHKHDHSADIPWEEVQRKANAIIERRPAFANMMMRSRVPKITRILMKSFERGLRFDGVKRDADDDQNDHMNKVKEKKAKKGKGKDGDTMIHPSRLANINGAGSRAEANGATMMTELVNGWGDAGMVQGTDDAAPVDTSNEADWGNDWGGGGTAQATGTGIITSNQAANLRNVWGDGELTKATGDATKTSITEAADWGNNWGGGESTNVTKDATNSTTTDEAGWGGNWGGAESANVPEVATNTTMTEVADWEAGWGGTDSNGNGVSTTGHQMMVDADTSVQAADVENEEVGIEEAGWGGV